MVVDAERRRPGDGLDHDLEPVVAERLDLSAVAADEMVMVIAGCGGRFVVRAPSAQLEPVDEPKPVQRLEGSVDARDPGAGPHRPDSVVDLGHSETAALLGEHPDHRAPRAAGPEPGLAQRLLGVFSPRHLAQMIAILIPGTLRPP